MRRLPPWRTPAQVPLCSRTCSVIWGTPEPPLRRHRGGADSYAAKRQDKSIAGLIREAVDAAMLEAGVEWGDIDAVVLGKAPDFSRVL